MNSHNNSVVHFIFYAFPSSGEKENGRWRRESRWETMKEEEMGYWGYERGSSHCCWLYSLRKGPITQRRLAAFRNQEGILIDNCQSYKDLAWEPEGWERANTFLHGTSWFHPGTYCFSAQWNPSRIKGIRVNSKGIVNSYHYKSLNLW